MRRNGLVSIVFDEVPPNTNYTAGRWSWVSDSTAQEYIEEGYGREWKPDEIKKPSMANTKKEIEQYLDSEGIEYDEYATKQQLLDLIDGE